MKKQLKFTIGPAETARQQETFTVSCPCSHLCFRYDLEPKYAFLVFFMVSDPRGQIRFLKQLGCSEPVISIGQGGLDTTVGGVPGEIVQGEWKVTVFLFSEHLSRTSGEQKIPFTVEVSGEQEDITECIGENVWVSGVFHYAQYDFTRVYVQKPGWYKGDLHTHTRLSDGRETPGQAGIKAELMGLDYYVPTEHNTLHTGWPDTRVLILPGTEITTILGHANLFGVDRLPAALADILADKKEEKLKQDLLEIQKECRKRGWLFSINHPFLYIWKWLYGEMLLSDVNCLEIENDPTYESDPNAQARTANEKARALCDLFWEDGYRICAVGGSDSHNKTQEFYPGALEPSIPGDPATFLYMDALSPENILHALKKCRAYVTRHCSIRTDLCFGEILPDSVENLSYSLEISGQIKRPVVYYLHNGRRVLCEMTWEREGTWKTRGEIILSEAPYQWIRFGAEDTEGEFLFYGNAITKGRKEHDFSTFAEAAEELERRWSRR